MIDRDIVRLVGAAKEAQEGLAEVVRLLGKVVPADKNRMIEWAVKSQDSVYTNAGAAFRIGKETLDKFNTALKKM
ncbi:hypothetical protein ES703_95800 [subsurface metagenome]